MALEYALKIDTQEDLTKAVVELLRKASPACNVTPSGNGLSIDLRDDMGLSIHVAMNKDGYVEFLREYRTESFELRNYYSVSFRLINNRDIGSQRNYMITFVKKVLALNNANAWLIFNGDLLVLARKDGEWQIDNSWEFWNYVEVGI